MIGLGDYPTGNLCNADPRVRPLPCALKPLIKGHRIAGPACTAKITPGQSAAIHRAVHHARPGEILVVDGASSERFGPFGDLLADACLAKGLAGAVFDCTIRDASDVAAVGFQVFSRGFHPEATLKTETDQIDLVLDIGGTRIAPGDIVVGDDDGVVIIPANAVTDIRAAAKQVAAREQAIRDRIRAGETTCEIFNIDPAVENAT